MADFMASEMGILRLPDADVRDSPIEIAQEQQRES
jgi:hypothetical protein